MRNLVLVMAMLVLGACSGGQGAVTLEPGEIVGLPSIAELERATMGYEDEPVSAYYTSGCDTLLYEDGIHTGVRPVGMENMVIGYATYAFYHDPAIPQERYQYVTAYYPPADADAKGQIYIGLADFGRGRWLFHRVFHDWRGYDTGWDLAFDIREAENPFNEYNMLYYVVIAYGEDSYVVVGNDPHIVLAEE